MAITVYRSRSKNADAAVELMETIARIDAAQLCEKPQKTVGVDSNLSEDVEKSLLRVLKDGQLDMFGSAYAMATLIDRFHMTQGELALRLSLSQSAVANKLRLLRFSEDERKRILGANLSERHARALLRLREEAQRQRCLEIVIDEHMSVSETERLVLSFSPDSDSHCRRGKGAIRDLRFFSNSIDRAVDLARRAGVALELERRESEGVIEIQIRVHKS